jgi:hypothetical protein
MSILKGAIGIVLGTWLLLGLFVSPVLWVCSAGAKPENRLKWIIAGFVNLFAWGVAIVLSRVHWVQSGRI